MKVEHLELWRREAAKEVEVNLRMLVRILIRIATSGRLKSHHRFDFVHCSLEIFQQQFIKFQLVDSAYCLTSSRLDAITHIAGRVRSREV